MNIETMQIPVISTVHLTREVADALTAQGDRNPWVICAPYEYGYFLWISEGSDRELSMPVCLQNIRDKLAPMLPPSLGVWVRLDSDGDKIAGLPAYDW